MPVSATFATQRQRGAGRRPSGKSSSRKIIALRLGTKVMLCTQAAKFPPGSPGWVRME
jgi:hypothetical protein